MILKLKWIYLFMYLITIFKFSEGLFHLPSMTTYTAPATEFNHSYFGYSVVYQGGSRRLLVGAPKADQNGKIFSCNMNDEVCSPIQIATEPVRSVHDYYYSHEILLGVSISSGSTFSVTCAPRYTNIKNDFFGTYGKCFSIPEYSNNGTKMKSLPEKKILLRLDRREITTDGYGWSVLVTKSDNIYIGSPPMSEGRVSYYKTPNNTPILLKSHARSKNLNIKFNFGYSIIEGKFSRGKASIAISTPYGHVGKGMVVVLSSKEKVEDWIEDVNVGTLFGASLCAADINGDGIQELIIGAPAFSYNKRGSDSGSIYIYENADSGEHIKFQQINSIREQTEGAYFGYSIINVGDINNDGLEDICVGAPYADEGRGAVYFYSGSSLRRGGDGRFRQKLQAGGVMGFGLSLARLADYDENGCDELAVGAPDSNKLFVFRSIASIELKVVSTFQIVQTLPVNATSFIFTSCFEVKFPHKPAKVTATIKTTTYIMHTDAKIAKPNEGSAYYFETKLNQTTKYCENILVALPLNGDYSEVIQYNVSAELLDNPLNIREFDPSRVLLKESSVLSVQGLIPASRGCKDKCVPQLDMELITPKSTDVNNYSSTDNIIIEAKITNNGDTAYGACVRIRIMDVFATSFPELCELKIDNLGFLYTCFIKTALYKGGVWETGPIQLAMKDLTNLNKFINITANLHDYCTNLTNFKTQNVIIKLKTHSNGINITSQSNHEDTIVVTSEDFNQKRLIQIEHSYTIINLGMTRWKNLKATLNMEPKYYTPIKNYDIMINGRRVLANGGKANVEFELPILERSNKIDVHIPFEIHAEELEELLKLRNLTLKTSLQVDFDGDVKRNGFENEIYFQPELKVPLWIILIAAIIGVLLMLLCGLILYEVGFFGRKNKKMLEELKQTHSLIIAARESIRVSRLISASTEDLVVQNMQIDEEDQ